MTGTISCLSGPPTSHQGKQHLVSVWTQPGYLSCVEVQHMRGVLGLSNSQMPRGITLQPVLWSTGAALLLSSEKL